VLRGLNRCRPKGEVRVDRTPRGDRLPLRHEPLGFIRELVRAREPRSSRRLIHKSPRGGSERIGMRSERLRLWMSATERVGGPNSRRDDAIRLALGRVLIGNDSRTPRFSDSPTRAARTRKGADLLENAHGSRSSSNEGDVSSSRPRPRARRPPPSRTATLRARMNYAADACVPASRRKRFSCSSCAPAGHAAGRPLLSFVVADIRSSFHFALAGAARRISQRGGLPGSPSCSPPLGLRRARSSQEARRQRMSTAFVLASLANADRRSWLAKFPRPHSHYSARRC